METYEDIAKYWEQVASNLLEGRKITKVSYLTKAECKSLGWTNHCVVIHLDNGVKLFPSMDDEGNNGGALFTSDSKIDCLPVIRDYGD